MKCPICRELAKKVTTDADGGILVRCGTDGDFYITAASRRKLEDVSGALRQQTLNNAIILRQPNMPPIIKKYMVASKLREKISRAMILDETSRE